MKKTLLLIAALATLASAMAKPVEPSTASRIASHWLQAVTGKTYDNLTDITAQTPFHEFYVFTLRAGLFRDVHFPRQGHARPCERLDGCL